MGDAADFIVRRTTVHDIDDQFDLMDAVAAERRWIGSEPPIDRAARRPRWEEQINDDSKGASFMAEAGGRMIGCLGLELAPYGVADLGMCIADGWRGKGVGSALMEAAVDWARASPAHKIALSLWPHNEAARALYDKFGFVEEGRLRRHYRRQSGEVWDAVVMGLLLDD
jgi:RimJ/RimL family protein N-acetyltransferase